MVHCAKQKVADEEDIECVGHNSCHTCALENKSELSLWSCFASALEIGSENEECGVYKIVKICKDRVSTLHDTKLYFKKCNHSLLMAKPLADKMSIALHTATPNIEDVYKAHQFYINQLKFIAKRPE